eukprot:TRINITY_DN98541_c0_g1_i1.p1 TRINITY_DN98541_c0_g1~~TRINITY_DN98541_c0_g1_i1.p1  ORF type:complete len:160 (-),score=19.97 TRINITY_DN98541_c0_g1_i1:49-504(-)
MSANVWSNLRDKFRTEKRCVETSCRDRSETSGDEDEVDPPDRAEIGRASWRYLHAMAAAHPERPTAQQERDTQAWIAAFVQFYPCSHCAEHFVDVCEAMPPRTGSREQYSVWWCEAHNKVNEALKCETKRCDPARLLAAGRQGLLLDDIPE